MGRVGAALAHRGHHVVGVDFDPEIIDQSRDTFPELPVVTSRLDQLTSALSSATRRSAGAITRWIVITAGSASKPLINV